MPPLFDIFAMPFHFRHYYATPLSLSRFYAMPFRQMPAAIATLIDILRLLQPALLSPAAIAAIAGAFRHFLIIVFLFRCHFTPLPAAATYFRHCRFHAMIFA